VLRADYDIILMDIQMPELDGIGAMSQIRAMPQPKCDIPIVAMTANAMHGAREEYLAAGMDEYVSKPVRPETLRAILDRLTRSRKRGGPSANDPSDKLSKLPVLDSTQLDSLSSVLSSDQLRDIQLLYLTETRNYVAEISALSLSGDFAAIARAAHVLVGTAGNVGAMQMSARAKLLEETCRRGERDKIGPLIEALEAAASASAHAIQSRMDATVSNSATLKLSA
jgi:CheY-like chemotaxis protein